MDTYTTTAALEAALAPVQAEHKRLTEEIERAEATLAELRTNQRRTKRVLDALNPPAKPKPKPSTNGHGELSLDRLEEFLHTLPPDQDVTSTDVGTATGVSRNHAAVQLRAAHDRGSLRLDRRGRGGQRIYRVIA